MSRDPSTLDHYFPIKDRRAVCDLIQKSFNVQARLLTGLEFESVRAGFVIPCGVRKGVGCTHVPCTRKSLGLDGATVVEDCYAGLKWGFTPVRWEQEELAYIQIGPFFTSLDERRRLLARRPELAHGVEEYPILPDPQHGALELVNQWLSDHIASRIREHRLASKETLLLSLVDSTKHIAGMSDPEELLDYLTEVSTYLTEASSGFILTSDGDDGPLRIVAAHGVSPDFNRNYRVPRSAGVTGWVVRNGKPLFVPDAERDPRYIAVGYRAASELAVPIRSGDRVIGVLVVDSMTPAAFTPFHVRVLEGLASQVAVVLETLGHRVDGRSKLRQLTALHEVSQAVHSSLQGNQVLHGVLGVFGDVFDISSCSILLAQGRTGRMLIKSVGRADVREVTGIDLSEDRGLLGYVIQQRKPLLIRPDSGPLFERFRDYISTDIASIMCAPLVSGEKLLGTLFVAGASGTRFGQDELDLLSTIARLVGQGLERAYLYERGQRQIAEMTLVNEMGKAVNSSLDLDQVLDYAVNMIGSIIEATSGSLMLLDEKSQILRMVASRNIEPGAQDLELKVGEGVAGWVAANRQPLILEDAQRDPRYRPNSRHNQPFSMISMPIVNKHKVLGVMNFERPLSRQAFTEEDLNPVSALASQAAVAIENASLYRHLIQVHFETIQSLANALEAKDPYTHGHSRRVSKDAVRIAQRLRLDPRQIETIRHAALLHDIGKIGVKDSVLLKPGPLTDEEYNHIKRHASLGAGILNSVEHLREVARFVRHHHERWDGNGYPQRLRSEDIPLGSRIICICDAFDAMITTRPYREGMAIERAVEQLVEGKGTQFDASLVDVFVELLKEHHPSIAGRLDRIVAPAGAGIRVA